MIQGARPGYAPLPARRLGERRIDRNQTPRSHPACFDRLSLTNLRDRLQVYSKLHNAIAASSLTKMCFLITTGCAYVALSATEYFATCSNPFALFLATIKLASFNKINSASFALRIAALNPSRPSVVHKILPVAASRQKYCPLRFDDIPNRWSPSSTGEFIYIAISGLCQTCFAVNSAPFLANWTAIMPLRTPEKISVFL